MGVLKGNYIHLYIDLQPHFAVTNTQKEEESKRLLFFPLNQTTIVKTKRLGFPGLISCLVIFKDRNVSNTFYD